MYNTNLDFINMAYNDLKDTIVKEGKVLPCNKVEFPTT